MEKKSSTTERIIKPANGIAMLILLIALIIVAVGGFVIGIMSIVENAGTYAYYDGKYKSGNPLEWTAVTPGEFRLECEIAPNGEKKEWHFEFQFKPADPALANNGGSGSPYLSLKFAAGKCDLAFGEWKDVYKNNSAEKATVNYAGGSIRLVVTYRAGKASIILGDGESPVLETEAHSGLLKRIAEGLVRFNGSGARLLSMKVMRPSDAADSGYKSKFSILKF